MCPHSGSPDCQKFGFLVNTLRCSGVKLWYTNGPVPFGFSCSGLKLSGMMYRKYQYASCSRKLP